MLRSKFTLQPRYLQLQSSHAVGLIGGLIRRQVGHGMLHERVPLILYFSQINRRLAIEGEAQEDQAGYPCHGRYSKAQRLFL
ncbi:MAG TPA: hypothetical protein VGC82_01800 [Rhodopila sp.]